MVTRNNSKSLVYKYMASPDNKLIPVDAIGRIKHTELKPPLFPELATIISQNLFDHPLNVASNYTLFVPRTLHMEKIKGVDTIVDPLDTTITAKRGKIPVLTEEKRDLLSEFAQGHVQDLAAIVLNSNPVGSEWTREEFYAGLLQATTYDLDQERAEHEKNKRLKSDTAVETGYLARISQKIHILTDLRNALQPEETPQKDYTRS